MVAVQFTHFVRYRLQDRHPDYHVPELSAMSTKDCKVGRPFSGRRFTVARAR